jgi:hypothetical protein
MLNTMTRTLLITMLCVCGFASVSNAQQTITTEKKALIKELLEVTGGHKTSEDMVSAMLEQMEKELPKLMSLMIDNDRHLTSTEKEELKKDVTRVALRASKRYREMFMQRVNIGQMVDDLSYQLYDKFFTDAEIRDLITFYRSSTGKKTIEVMPSLMAESIAKTSETLLPTIQQIIREVTEAELARYIKEKNNKPRARGRS